MIRDLIMRPASWGLLPELLDHNQSAGALAACLGGQAIEIETRSRGHAVLGPAVPFGHARSGRPRAVDQHPDEPATHVVEREPDRLRRRQSITDRSATRGRVRYRISKHEPRR